MYNLFLDDVRNPNKFLDDIRSWEIVRNHAEFTRIIQQRGLPQFISFDHDLAFEHYDSSETEYYVEKTGYDCAKWLIEYCMKTHQQLPEWQVHSMNPVGKVNIENLLKNYETKFQNIDED